MFRNYIITSLRLLYRNRLYTVINLTGLATGMACFILLMLYVTDEAGYDTFHSKKDRIYRVIGILELEGQGEQSSSCPFPVGPALQNDYGHLIEQSVRFFDFQDPQHTLSFGGRKFNEERIYLADSAVFQVFDFPLQEGDPATALAKPASIVLNRELADKYFPGENPVGKLLKFDGMAELMVTGVFGDIPDQSHIHPRAFISFSTIRQLFPNIHRNWVWNPCWTYVLLKEGVKPAELEAAFPAFVQKYYPDFLKPQVKHLLQPLADIHLHSKYSYEIEPNSDVKTVYILSAIGFFILFTAGINYINMTTATSANRSREVGMRKVSGADRRQLITQFLCESMVMSLLAVILALTLAELVIPFYNDFTGKHLVLSFSSGRLWLWVGCALLFTGLLSGFYPALVLSAFRPAAILKTGNRSTGRFSLLRRSLVVVQFVISLVLIIATLVIYRQVDFLRKSSPGFNREQVVMIPVRPPMAKYTDHLVEELERKPGVLGVATMNDVVGRHHNVHEYNFEGMQEGKWIYYPSLIVSQRFVQTLGLQLIAGRDFSKEYVRDDSLAVIVNEAMVKHMQWGSPQQALGRQMFTPGGHERVIGVVKDFNYVALNQPIKPFVLDMPNRFTKAFFTRYIAVRLSPETLPSTLATLENTWKENIHEFPFEYFFLDQNLQQQYKHEEKLMKLVGLFSVLSIVIACLGLFALASYTVSSRKKEIGIRKVVGASEVNILRLLFTDFLKLIFIANLVAWPLSYFILDYWLSLFAYRIHMPFGVFLLAGLASMLIAAATVWVHTLRSARTNPAEVLKYE